MNAIVLRNVQKSFRKQTIRGDYTTFKSELVRLFRGSSRKERAAVIPALLGVDLAVPQGKTLGIIGRNGSGKSTLLKLITGIYRPTAGTVEVNGRVSALLELGSGFHPDFSGRENIFINGMILGMSKAELKKKLPEIIAFSELGDFIDEPVRTYSSGMFMRLAFSVATHVDPDVLIVDEILAVGDEHFSHKSFAKMNEFKRTGKTILLVSHDLFAVQRWCDTVAWLDAGKIRMVGPPDRVIDEYRRAVAESEAAAHLSATQSPPVEAMPAQELVRPSFGPRVAADRRWGTFELEIEGVRLEDAQGNTASSVDTEDPLDVVIDYRAKQPLDEVHFGLSLYRNDGTLVYGTSTAIDGVNFPQPIPMAGTVRFSFARVGFTDGAYVLDVAAHTRNGVNYDFHKGLTVLTVSSKLQDTGIARPAHTWALEPKAELERRASN
jgi:lipopolysaccharide transport system ATP-binding protein